MHQSLSCKTNPETEGFKIQRNCTPIKNKLSHRKITVCANTITNTEWLNLRRVTVFLMSKPPLDVTRAVVDAHLCWRFSVRRHSIELSLTRYQLADHRVHSGAEPVAGELSHRNLEVDRRAEPPGAEGKEVRFEEVVGEVGNSPENEGPPPSPTVGRRWW